MKEILVLLMLIFWMGMSYGQSGPIEGSLTIKKEDSKGLTKFEQYVNSTLVHKEDTVTVDTIPKKYRLMYSASCYYSEHWINEHCAYGTEGESFVKHLTPAIDTLSTDAMFAQIKPPYFCAENPVTYLGAEAVFVLKNGMLFNADTSSQFDIDITPSYGWRYTPKIAYDNGRFLVLETISLDSTGKELLQGITTTFFLESVE